MFFLRHTVELLITANLEEYSGHWSTVLRQGVVEWVGRVLTPPAWLLWRSGVAPPSKLLKSAPRE